MLKKLNKILNNNKFFSVAKMDGFLTAIISSPNLIHPLKWIKITKITDLDLDTIFLFYNRIYLDLQNNCYSPIFIQSSSENLLIDLNNWANGYILGKNLWDPYIVEIYKIDVNQLLSPILDLLHSNNTPSNFIDHLLKSCAQIYQFWLQQSLLIHQP